MLMSPTLTRLCEAQNWRCCYCAIELVDGCTSDAAATIDHVTARSVGGRDHSTNFAAACRLCNNSRGALSAHLYLLFVKERGRHGAALHAKSMRHRASAKKYRKEREAAAERKTQASSVDFSQRASDVPIEYEDPVKQLAFENAYRGREWLLR